MTVLELVEVLLECEPTAIIVDGSNRAVSQMTVREFVLRLLGCPSPHAEVVLGEPGDDPRPVVNVNQFIRFYGRPEGEPSIYVILTHHTKGVAL